MIDKPRFADGSVIYFAIAFAGLVALCLLGKLLGTVGVPVGIIAAIFVFAALGLAALQALSASRRDGQPTEMANGVAVSMEWLSAFGLFGIVGGLFAFGHDGLALLIGLAAGFVLSTVLIAPRLAMAPSRSMPDFLAMRYSSEAMRYGALAVMALVAVLFVAAQLVACGLIAEHGLGVAPGLGVVLGVAGLLSVTLPAGMRSLSAAQVALAVVAIVGIAIASVWLLSAKTGIVIPHLAYGGLFFDISAAENRLGLEAHFGLPSAMLGLRDVMLVIVCLAIGSSVMPHSIARVSMVGDAPRTGRALRRGLIYFVLIATALPALAVLAKAQLYGLFTASEGIVAFDALPSAWGSGVTVCEAPASQMRDACEQAGFTEGVSIDGLAFDAQRIWMLVPSMAGAAGWMLALFSLIGFAVAVSAAGGAALGFAAAATSRSPRAEAALQMRLFVVVLAVAAVIVSLISGANVISLGAWAFSLIGSALFAPLVLGLWWRRTTRDGAVAGLVGGFAITALYIVGASWGFDLTAETGDEWSWLGAPPLAAGAFGIGLSLFLTFWVSLATKLPTAEQRALVDAMEPQTPSIAGPAIPE